MTEILILDGGLGTTLEQNHGVEFTPSQPLWSSHLVLSDPATLLACQRSFARVPVDMLLTATYQISIEGLAATKTPSFPDGIHATDDMVGVLDAAVTLAHEASSGAERARVALSIGPYGACMVPSAEYSGIYDAQHDDAAALTAWHAQRMALFAQVRGIAQRVAYVAVETVPRRDEIAAARAALAETPRLAGIPCWISCLYPTDPADPTGRLALPDGSSPEQVVRATLDPSTGAAPWGIGINCTKVGVLGALVARYEREITRMQAQGLVAAWPALVLYPDGTDGEAYNTATQAWEPQAGGSAAAAAAAGGAPWEEQLAQVVRGAAARGLWSRIVVGGCCRALPGHIARLRGCLKATDDDDDDDADH